MTDEQIAEIRKRVDASTPGPWDWFGNTSSQTVWLATVDRGRIWILDFARYGMRGAGPRFRGAYTSRVGDWLKRQGRYEVLRYRTRAEAGIADDADRGNSPLYREDWQGIDHPDAELIAHAPDDLRALLAEVDRCRTASAPEPTR